MCLDLGRCKDGKCVPFCEREQQLESCACNGELTSLHLAGMVVRTPWGQLGCGALCGTDSGFGSEPPPCLRRLTC